MDSQGTLPPIDSPTSRVAVFYDEEGVLQTVLHYDGTQWRAGIEQEHNEASPADQNWPKNPVKSVTITYFITEVDTADPCFLQGGRLICY
jgi:hypothetical protein